MTPFNRTTLAQFTGSNRGYRHVLVNTVVYTEGVKYIAESAGAYWLLDEIALAQLSDRAVAAEKFQVWTLSINVNKTAILKCEDGDKHIVFRREIK